MSPTRLEWLLRLSLRQMDAARLEGYNANDKGQWPNACPYKKETARHFAWMRGWRQSERSRGPATN